MKYNIKIGNILDAPENIICHQVNMQKKMGSGLAKQIRDRYPQVYNTYLSHNGYLGEVLIVKVNNDNDLNNYKAIANIYSQNKYGYDGKQYTDYIALRDGLSDIVAHIKASNSSHPNIEFSLAIPYNIGCGLGGGDWTIVSEIIKDECKDIQYSIYKLQ